MELPGQQTPRGFHGWASCPQAGCSGWWARLLLVSMSTMKKSPRTLDEVALARLLRGQDGVVSRQQVLELGGRAADIRRKRRRREWAIVHDGVYVQHTGPITSRQRRWAALLACWPAVLHRGSALDAHGFSRDRRPTGGREPIRVAVDASRKVVPPSGVHVERVRGLASWTMAQRRPPRVTVDFAALKEAADCTESEAIALLADVCRQGLTTAARLRKALVHLTRLPGRSAMLAVLHDVESGTYSLLEHRYLELVERAHGLPSGQRQRREVAADRVVFRDVRYAQQRALVELDGRFGHSDTDDRWDDLDRDLAAAVSGSVTVRLGWRQVLEPCRVAAAISEILASRGWAGSPFPCSPDCPLTDRGSVRSADDPDPPRTDLGA